jgi:polar amino acid transport system substrate-binding protein
MTSTTPARHASRPASRPPALLIVPVVTLLLLVGTPFVLPAPPPLPVPVQDVQPPHQWQPGRLRVGVDAAYPPFVQLADGRFSGHDVELAERLADHLGLTLEMVNIPFDGLYDALRVSRIDIIISALPYLEELEGTVIYSRPYFQAGEVLIVRPDTRIRGPRDLRGRVVGVELGSLGDQTARRLLAERDEFTLRSDYDSAETAVRSLLAREVDAVMVDRVEALTLVRTSPGLTIAEAVLSDVPYVIAMPYDEPALARRVNNWLTTLEKNGTLRRLTETYLG